MSAITIYTQPFCLNSLNAKSLLDRKGLKYNEIAVDNNNTKHHLIKQLGKIDVPQIFIDGMHLGGYKDLYHFMRKYLHI